TASQDPATGIVMWRIAERKYPIAVTIMADGTVPMMPPTDIPISMALIGAGDVRYISKSPSCLSQLNWLTMDHRTFPQKETITPPRMANPTYPVAPML